MSKSRHGLCIFVDNEFGVIQRVTNLFSARGMNIETINTQEIHPSLNISQISISLIQNKQNIELICKLLMRILVVHNVSHIETKEDSYATQIFDGNLDPHILSEFPASSISYFAKNNIHCITSTLQNIANINEKISNAIRQYKSYRVF